MNLTRIIHNLCICTYLSVYIYIFYGYICAYVCILCMLLLFHFFCDCHYYVLAILSLALANFWPSLQCSGLRKEAMRLSQLICTLLRRCNVVSIFLFVICDIIKTYIIVRFLRHIFWCISPLICLHTMGMKDLSSLTDSKQISISNKNLNSVFLFCNWTIFSRDISYFQKQQRLGTIYKLLILPYQLGTHALETGSSANLSLFQVSLPYLSVFATFGTCDLSWCFWFLSL